MREFGRPRPRPASPPSHLRDTSVKTAATIADELIADMREMARVMRPYGAKWTARKDDMALLDREMTPELSERLRQASREMDEAAGRFS